VRRVPFATQRPTFSELKRVIWVLGSVRKVTLPHPAQQQEAAADAREQEEQAGKKQEKAAAAAAAATAAAAAAAPLPAVKKQVCDECCAADGVLDACLMSLWHYR
jgi:hypothetical protein